MRHNWLLAVLLAFAFGLIIFGLFRWSDVVGYIGAGVLLGAWSLLFVWNVPEETPGSGGDE